MDDGRAAAVQVVHAPGAVQGHPQLLAIVQRDLGPAAHMPACQSSDTPPSHLNPNSETLIQKPIHKP